MNADRLLALFEEISEAPDAIPRLRRFILDLAVRGKLVEQDPEDEPAEVLLEGIAAERIYLEKIGKLKRSKRISDPIELPFNLPESWRWTQLASVGILNPRNSAPDELDAAFVPMPYISTEYGVPNSEEVRPWREIKKGYTHFGEGDVGLAKITPCFENGKSTVFRKLTGGIGSGTTELHILRPLQMSSEYILIFLKSPHFISNGIPRMTGTAGQKRIPLDYFALSPFALPPLAEQHRIVAKVDELMALCDQLEAARQQREQCRERLVASSLQRLNQPSDEPEAFRNDARFALQVLPGFTSSQAQIKQLRQTILNLAVRGKLVEQDPEDEPAEELISRIIAAKRKKGRENVASLAGTTDGNPLQKLPKGWAWMSFEGYSLSINTGPFGTTLPQSDYIEGGIPLVNPSHMKDQVIVCDPRVSVSEQTAARLSSYRLSDGDLVIARRGEVGRVALVGSGEDGWICGTGSFFASFVEEVPRDYLLLFMLSSFARGFLGSEGIGATMTNLNQKILKRLPIPLPPLAEQHRIVAKVDELMALCDQLEQQLSQAEQSRRGLLEAVLREALRVPEANSALQGRA